MRTRELTLPAAAGAARVLPRNDAMVTLPDTIESRTPRGRGGELGNKPPGDLGRVLYLARCDRLR